MLGQIHTQLSDKHYVCLATLAIDILLSDLEIIAGALHYLVHGDGTLALGVSVMIHDTHGKLQVHITVEYHGVG